MEYTQEQMDTAVWIRKISDESERGWHAFYHTSEWRTMRRYILRRDHHECVRCREVHGRYTKATTVHHIKHLKDEPELALTESNLVSLCPACHDEVHPELQKKINVVTVERW